MLGRNETTNTNNLWEELMKKYKTQLTAAVLFAFFTFGLFGCKSDNTILDPGNTGSQTDEQALLKLTDNDESLESFEPNYNEENAMDFGLGKTSTQIYPLRVGQRMFLVDRSMDVTFDGDSAIGLLTKNFSGTLYIAGSYTPADSNGHNTIDTVLQKQFSTTVTRKIIFEKRANTALPDSNWKIKAISLPEGGTLNPAVEIASVSIFYPSGDSMLITEPNEYFLYRGPGFRHQIPVLHRFRDVRVVVEVNSAYADTDYVTLTYGAMRSNRLHRSKKRFELVSSTFDGTTYHKTYEGTWKTLQFPGWKHAIINIIPFQAVNDDSAPVEENTWGIPYIVL